MHSSDEFKRILFFIVCGLCCLIHSDPVSSTDRELPLPSPRTLRALNSDRSSAAKLFKEAAEIGDIYALYNESLLFSDAGQCVQAYDLAKEAADEGFVFAQYLAGALCLGGQLPKCNEEEGIRRIRDAARLGHRWAQSHLASYLSDESGNLKPSSADREESDYWYSEATKSGVLEAKYHLALKLFDDDAQKEKGMELLTQAAEGGAIEAAFELGAIAAETKGGEEKARDWFRMCVQLFEEDRGEFLGAACGVTWGAPNKEKLESYKNACEKYMNEAEKRINKR